MKRVYNNKGYQEFEATMLYCPHCQQTVPVRKKLLIILPEGDKYDYCCSRCGRPIGAKLDKKQNLKTIY
jgi:transposase-like protein